VIADALRKLSFREDLTADEAEGAMDAIMRCESTPAQIAGFVMGLRGKGEKAAEVAGCVRSMRKHSVKIHVNDSRAVDGCGTGGDGGHTFNVSTTASLITAGAGVTVAKHGNRSVSSQCGSADVLEALGGNIDPGRDAVESQVNEIGFGFMFAPRFHPAMKHAALVRKELGVRTVFNILGPLTNPASVRRQVIGVYDKRIMRLVAEVLALNGCDHALVVHSQDGLDEFSVSAPSDFIEVQGSSITNGTIVPESLGLRNASLKALAGGDSTENARIVREVLGGSSGAPINAALLNAGALLYVAERAESIRDGVALAREAVTQGKSIAILDRWIAASSRANSTHE
jgi:anthranilate phosphoribosyltransferase